MKVAIVGLGAAGNTIHLPALAKLRDVRVVGAVELSQSTKRDLGFPVYSTIEQLFLELSNDAPDIVIVCTPTELHFEQCRYALQHGAHVLCEKPFVESIPQARELISLAKSCNLKMAVNNEFRFMRIHQAAKAKIGSAEFGRLVYLDIHQTFRTTAGTEKGWRGADARRTCKEFGTHVFDLARYFYGCDPISIFARMPRPYADSGADYLNLIDLRFPNDCFARITLDRLTRGKHRYLDMRLDGESGCVETSLGGQLEFVCGLNPKSRRPFLEARRGLGGTARFIQEESGRQIESDPIDLFPNATASLIEAFIDAIKADAEPPCSARDNLMTLGLMLAAYDSAESHQEIVLNDYIYGEQ